MNSNNSNINYFINGSKYQYHKIEVNAVSADTVKKKPLVDWKQWQNKLISEETFLKWIELDLIDKGLAIISGLAYREIRVIFSTTIKFLITVTGNSNSICILSMSIANNT